jgi:hypothetical protein
MNPFADVFKSFEEAFSCKKSCERSKNDPMVPFAQVAQRIVPADVRTNPGSDNRMQAGHLVFFGEESADFPMAFAGTAAGSMGRTGFSVTVGPQYRANSGQLSDQLDINTRCATLPLFPRLCSLLITVTEKEHGWEWVDQVHDS